MPLLLEIAFASACASSPSTLLPPASGPIPTPAGIPVAPTAGSPAPTPTRVSRPTAIPTAAATPGPTAENPLLIDDSDWTRGPLTATVVIIEYADFQCAKCGLLASTLAKLQAAHPDQILLVFRQFPLLGLNDKSLIAAEAAEAAGTQGKFWALHDLLFERQAEWVGLSAEIFASRLSDWAAEIGLNTSRFVAELNAGADRDKVMAAYNAALTLGVPGAPTLIINGNVYGGPLDFHLLDAVVRLESLQARQLAAPPEFAIDIRKHYEAVLHTSRGDIVIALFPERAPLTVNNYIFLAQQGWYNGVSFHRVVPGQMAQTGDPSGTGYGNPGYTIPDELNTGLTFDAPGFVAMANTGPNTAGSQFFVTLSALPDLNGQFTIFGRVTSGLDVLQALGPRDPVDPEAPPGEIIRTVTITEK